MIKRRGKFGRTAERLARPAVFFVRGVVDFVYPPLCLICEERLEAASDFVCGCCRSALMFIQEPIQDGSLYVHKVGGEVFFSHTVAFFHYTPAVQKLIHAFKYQNLSRLISFFAGEMSRMICGLPLCTNADYIVPVPLHGTRKRERGYNQAELLAKELSAAAGIPLLSRCLTRRRYTGQQAKLDGTQRAENVRNAFWVSRPELVKHRTLLVVDDVLTTGHTMNECARVLLQAGASEVTALTIVRI